VSEHAQQRSVVVLAFRCGIIRVVNQGEETVMTALPVLGQKQYTAEAFEALCQLPDYLDARIELIEGKIVEMSPTQPKHGYVTPLVIMVLLAFVKPRQLGVIFGGETGFVLFSEPGKKQTVVAPDVAYVSKERLPSLKTQGFMRIAPDLAVEVISPSERPGKVQEKVELYLRAGTRLVWNLYPERVQVVVHTPHGVRTYHAADTLDGGDVLPDFSVTVRDLFDEPLLHESM
jgi:Uma2 family endonuclease